MFIYSVFFMCRLRKKNLSGVSSYIVGRVNCVPIMSVLFLCLTLDGFIYAGNIHIWLSLQGVLQCLSSS